MKKSDLKVGEIYCVANGSINADGVPGYLGEVRAELLGISEAQTVLTRYGSETKRVLHRFVNLGGIENRTGRTAMTLEEWRAQQIQTMVVRARERGEKLSYKEAAGEYDANHVADAAMALILDDRRGGSSPCVGEEFFLETGKLVCMTWADWEKRQQREREYRERVNTNKKEQTERRQREYPALAARLEAVGITKGHGQENYDYGIYGDGSGSFTIRDGAAIKLLEKLEELYAAANLASMASRPSESDMHQLREALARVRGDV